MTTTLRSFSFSIPRTLMGIGAGEELGPIISEVHARKPLIVTDEYLSKTSLVEALVAPLKREGLQFGIFDGCKPDAPFSTVEKCNRMFGEGEYDLLVAFGGGSVLDTAKAVSVIAAGQGHALQDCLGQYKVNWTAVPTILIPTTSGTGSEWTWVAIVTDDSIGIKRSIYSYSLRPLAVIVDPSFTADLPPRITAETGMDALIHGIEGYTSWKANIVSDMFAEKAIRLVSDNLRFAYGQGKKNMEARYNMAVAASLAFSFIFSGLGLSHAMAYPLQMMSHISHGASCSIMMPYVMEFNLPASRDKFAVIAELMGEKIEGLSLNAKAQKAIDAVVQLSKDVGMPQRMRDVGIRREDIPDFVENVLEFQPHVIDVNVRNAEKSDLAKIFEAAW
ncbi:MAG TPA: iron-containing alcohol dehydrogenase [Syntrophales bacterium]|nr:iron-containing alcohol dehydrogenase [Syntrophales bacterium]